MVQTLGASLVNFFQCILGELYHLLHHLLRGLGKEGTLSWRPLHEATHPTSEQPTFFYWSIIALQCCVSFCHPMKWISHNCTHIPLFSGTSLPLTPHPRELKWNPCAIEEASTNSLFIHARVYTSIPISQFVPPSRSPPPPCLHFSSLCQRLIPAL